MNHTKIVATIGPASIDPDVLASLIDHGVSVARLNASHADPKWHANAVSTIRRIAPQLPILMDIPGKKIRTIALAHEPSFDVNDKIILTTDTSHDGSRKVPVSWPHLNKKLKAGDIILADDGTLRFTVEQVDGLDIVCIAEVAGTLKSRKGINVPMVPLDMELMTDRDRFMIAFAVEQGVDFVGISFVESAAHVDLVRDACGPSGPAIVAKIENAAGLSNMVEVIEAADAIMIDRGDLSVETRLETVAIEQKRILAQAIDQGKPVIVATEMLHSMIDNPSPTKAEIADITNAVLDGASATMLSGETAAGSFPLKAVKMMRAVTNAAENYLWDSGYITPKTSLMASEHSIPSAMRHAISSIISETYITKIVAITISGYAARVVASARPKQPVIAITNDPRTARRANLYAGTTPFLVDIPFHKNSTDHIGRCLELAWRAGRLELDDVVLVTSVAYPASGNRMNIIQTHRVSDLVTSIGWQSQRE
jgi:pyruvate kinase